MKWTAIAVLCLAGALIAAGLGSSRWLVIDRGDASSSLGPFGQESCYGAECQYRSFSDVLDEAEAVVGRYGGQDPSISRVIAELRKLAGKGRAVGLTLGLGLLVILAMVIMVSVGSSLSKRHWYIISGWAIFGVIITSWFVSQGTEQASFGRGFYFTMSGCVLAFAGGFLVWRAPVRDRFAEMLDDMPNAYATEFDDDQEL